MTVPAGSVAARPGRLAVGVVGSGRVGPVLAAALAGAGHRVVAATAVSRASRRRVAELLPAAAVRAADEVLADCELALLTVPDDVLADLVAGLAGTGAVRPGQLLLHTSGRFGTGVLAPARRVGAVGLAVHPMMTFLGTAVDLQRLVGCPFGVTAAERMLPVAEALVLEMGGEPVRIAERARPLYHAAMTHGANHLVTLVNETVDLLRLAGVDEPARLLGPLLGAALDNALRHGEHGLTGPVSRGDAAAVGAHVEVLGRLAPQALPGYLALARRTADRALADGRLSPADAAALLDVLADRRTPP